jgi:transposase
MPSAAIGGVPKAIICDNLKAGITATCRYEPGINRTYQELAEHYDTAILPARPRKPRDKAKVEVAVQIVQRFVLARLRNRRFFSLNELNAEIRETVADLNAKIMRKLGLSRDELFAEIDRPALKALPSTPYQYAEWKRCRVAPDYHVEIADHYYSVPSRLIREELEARITDTTIEILHKGVRVASHARSYVRQINQSPQRSDCMLDRMRCVQQTVGHPLVRASPGTASGRTNGQLYRLARTP